MSAPDRAVLQDIATECVTLVARQFDRHLDWSLASLVELDAACDDLLADGPLGDQRLDLWWRLIDKVLRAEPYKSLASFARALPAIAARTQAGPSTESPAPEEPAQEEQA